MKDQIFRFLFPFWIVFIFQPVWTLSVRGQTETLQTAIPLRSVLKEIPKEQISKINSISEQSLPLPVDAIKTKFIPLSKEYSLSNGLKVIFIKDKAFPFVSCFTWYKVGSRDDPPAMTGLTHLVEHLLFQNIGNFNGNQWANNVVRSGGEFSGFTSEDFVAFYSNLPTYQLELAIRGEAARMRSAHFTKADVTKEVEHLVKEEKVEEQDPMHMLNREVHALAYERHPYHNPPGGWRHELERLTFNEAKAFYDKYFYPNNASLVLVGNFDEEIASNLIEKHFGPIARSENIPVNVYPQERPQLAEREIRLKTHNGKESIILAYKVAGISDADAPVVSILEQFLNKQIKGPLHAQLIDSGLCSSVQVAFEQKRDPGLLLIKCAGITANGSDKVLQILDSCLHQLREKQLSEADVNRLVQQTEFAYYSDGDGPYRCAFQTGFFTTLAKSEDVRLWPKKISQVTGVDILRVAKAYLNEDNRVLGHLAVANVNVTSEGKKIDCLSEKEQLSFSRNEKNALSRTLANEHYRLAAYGSASPKPYTVLAQNTTSVPISSVKLGAAIEHAKPETSPLQYKTLRNGIRVVVLESHLNPLVQVCGAVKAGSIYEHVDERGMSKLLAGLFDMGNTRINKQQLIAEQDDLGMPPNTMLKFNSTAEDITFHTKCLNEDFSLQMRYLLGCLMEPRLQNADFEAAKIDVASSLRRSEKLSENRVARAFLRSLIAAKSAYCPIYPEEEISSMGNYKLNDLVDFYHEHVSPTNTTILICGDVQSAEVFNLLEQLTQGWILNAQAYANPAAIKNVCQPELIPSNRSAYKSSLILPYSNSAEVMFGRIIPVSNVKQTVNYWAALSIADCALSKHPIFSHIAEQFNLKSELFDNAADDPWNTRIFKLENKLIWSLDIHLLPKSSSAAAVSAIQNLLSQFSKCGLRQEEVLEAKKYLIGSIPVKECSNLEELTDYTFNGVNELNETAPIIEMQKTINSLKYEDINEFIAKIFKLESAALVVAGPRELIKQIRPVQQIETVEVNSD